MSESVLVVDDDGDVRALVAELLSRAGYRVSQAENGREALKTLYDERPDLIVLDVSMPELDGWGTLERIRELSDVPVMMLTALGAELEKVRARRGAREVARAARRRGRLHDKAVRPPGAARAGREPPAPRAVSRAARGLP